MRFLIGISFFLIAYSYAGYPLLLWFLTRERRKNRKAFPAPMLDSARPYPFLSLVVSAYNEEKVIEQKIQNCLRLQYPKDRFEILIGTDGCTDQTPALVRRYQNQGVTLFEYPVRRGKPAVLNETVPQARGDVIVFSDAYTVLREDVLLRMAEHFSDPRLGVVSGFSGFLDPTARQLEKHYFDYDKFLKTLEGDWGVLLGAHGACYAVRKKAWRALAQDTLIDDFVSAIETQARGYQARYDRDIMAIEEASKGFWSEYRRRVRIGAGGYQSLSYLKDVIFPRRRGLRRLSFAFWSHKILRWLGPFLLLFLWGGSATLLGEPCYALFWGLQTFFYILAGLGLAFHLRHPEGGKAPLLLEVPFYFVGINVALLHGFLKHLFGKQKVTWSRTERNRMGSEYPSCLECST